MKAKKHTKALIMALSVVSMLMASLFVVNTGQAGAVYPECPENFELSQDQKSCWQAPTRVTIQDPDECKVKNEYGQWVPKGDITPDGKHCITDVSYNDQDFLQKGDIIPAKTTPGSTSYSCPSGWTGPVEQNGKQVCTMSSGKDVFKPALSNTSPGTCSQGTLDSATGKCVTPATTKPGTYVPGKDAVGPSCTAGYTYFPADGVGPEKCYAAPMNFSTCPAGGSADPSTTHADGRIKGCLSPVIPGSDATPATCNGAVTTAPASECKTDVPAVITDPTPGTTKYYCEDGWMLTADNQCMSQVSDTNTIDAQANTSSGTATCPEGYTGPTSDGKCERVILAAQPKVPTCKEGTLLKVAKNQYTCLLDNKPVPSEPEVRAECKKGTYDPKQDKCFVSAVAGAHQGSVNVVDKKGAATAPAEKKPEAPKKSAPAASAPAKIGFTG